MLFIVFESDEILNIFNLFVFSFFLFHFSFLIFH